MKAIRVRTFGEPEVLKLVDLDIPEPGSDDVLVKVEAIGVNPVDAYIRAGNYPIIPALPFTPGKDVSGIIVKVGEDVKKWKEGDRVYSAGTLSGGYAEYAVCRHSQVFSLPANMDFTHGAAIGIPGAAAWRALFTRARGKNGDRLLVHGASGSVGMIAIQLAVSTGLEVSGTAGTEKGLAQIRQAGAKKTYKHSDPRYLEEIVADCGEKGYDIILEMLANVNLANDLALLGTRGRVVVIGSRGEITIDPRATMAKETEILGMSLFNSSDEEMKEAQVGLYQLMSSGRLVPQIAQQLPLEEARKAHRQILESGNSGKILLIP
ncbi:NADPH:quinone reductase [Desulfopila inferna]|uniref:NADPH:quinone reductase n=1 Tax=Desulfopila inferna TaxID=468528 RepID=UPI001966A71C|nr:NADPH:quinone reductase [Desulfopila inferna]MBM9605023.1 NADPH:quinone reductase [Desulfopila inferna]